MRVLRRQDDVFFFSSFCDDVTTTSCCCCCRGGMCTVGVWQHFGQTDSEEEAKLNTAEIITDHNLGTSFLSKHTQIP